MDNLNSSFREITDHRDEGEIFGAGAPSVRRLATKPDVVPTPAGAGWYHDAAIEAVGRQTIDAQDCHYHH